MLADYERRLAEYWAEVKARDNVPTFGEFLEFVLAREPTGEGTAAVRMTAAGSTAPCGALRLVTKQSTRE